ncbi:hypothetical protein Tco_0417187 [Tanacetum coccineum]
MRSGLTSASETKSIFAETTQKTAKVKGSALDAEIQIILLENVQSHRETRTKEHLLEVLARDDSGKKMIRKDLNKTCLVAQAPNGSVPNLLL